MKRFVQIVVALTLPASTLAQPTDGNANLNVVLTNLDYAICGGTIFDDLEEMRCEDLTSAPIDGPSFLWVVISDRDMFPYGIAGIRFGIKHEMQMAGWSICTGGSQSAIGGWPASGAGNNVTWLDGCYYPPGENAVVGFFVLQEGSSGWMMLTHDPRVDTALWYDCTSIEQGLDPRLMGSLDSKSGGKPNCEPTPTLRSSWGQIKAHY